MTKVVFKQGEARPLVVSLEESGIAYSIPVDTEFFLGVKKKKGDANYIFSHINADFTVVDQTGGVISVVITATDSNQDPGLYVGELMMTTASGVIDKTVDLQFVIEEAVID